MSEMEVSHDLLHGADAVANFLGLSRRQIYHYVEKGALPVFRIGTSVVARRSTLTAWIECQERAAAPKTYASRAGNDRRR